MSVFKPFTTGEEVSDDNYNQEVSGNNYLSLGTHEVTVMSVDPGAYDDGVQFIDVILENEEGKSYKDRVVLGAQPDKKDPSKMDMSFGFKRFCNFLPKETADDQALRIAFFKRWFTADAKNLGAVIGMKAEITIVEGWKGYTIKEDTVLGGKFIYDVKIKGQVPDTPIFDDYDSAKAHAEGVLDLKQAYNQLGTLKALTPEENSTQAAKAMKDGVAAPKMVNRQAGL